MIINMYVGIIRPVRECLQLLESSVDSTKKKTNHESDRRLLSVLFQVKKRRIRFKISVTGCVFSHKNTALIFIFDENQENHSSSRKGTATLS